MRSLSDSTRNVKVTSKAKEDEQNDKINALIDEVDDLDSRMDAVEGSVSALSDSVTTNVVNTNRLNATEIEAHIANADELHGTALEVGGAQVDGDMAVSGISRLSEVRSTTGTINTLNSTDATIENATITNADITNIDIDNLSGTNMSYENATFDDVDVNNNIEVDGNIIVGGNISASGSLTASSGDISSLSSNEINATDVDAVNVESTNGKITFLKNRHLTHDDNYVDINQVVSDTDFVIIELPKIETGDYRVTYKQLVDGYPALTMFSLTLNETADNQWFSYSRAGDQKYMDEIAIKDGRLYIKTWFTGRLYFHSDTLSNVTGPKSYGEWPISLDDLDYPLYEATRQKATVYTHYVNIGMDDGEFGTAVLSLNTTDDYDSVKDDQLNPTEYDPNHDTLYYVYFPDQNVNAGSNVTWTECTATKIIADGIEHTGVVDGQYLVKRNTSSSLTPETPTRLSAQTRAVDYTDEKLLQASSLAYWDGSSNLGTAPQETTSTATEAQEPVPPLYKYEATPLNLYSDYDLGAEEYETTEDYIEALDGNFIGFGVTEEVEESTTLSDQPIYYFDEVDVTGARLDKKYSTTAKPVADVATYSYSDYPYTEAQIEDLGYSNISSPVNSQSVKNIDAESTFDAYFSYVRDGNPFPTGWIGNPNDPNTPDNFDLATYLSSHSGSLPSSESPYYTDTYNNNNVAYGVKTNGSISSVSSLVTGETKVLWLYQDASDPNNVVSRYWWDDGTHNPLNDFNNDWTSAPAYFYDNATKSSATYSTQVQTLNGTKTVKWNNYFWNDVHQEWWKETNKYYLERREKQQQGFYKQPFIMYGSQTAYEATADLTTTHIVLKDYLFDKTFGESSDWPVTSTELPEGSTLKSYNSSTKTATFEFVDPLAPGVSSITHVGNIVDGEWNAGDVTAPNGTFDNLTINDSVTVAEDLNVDGDVSIGGDLTVAGKVITVHTEEVTTEENTIELRHDAQTGLTPGDISGIIINNYDGLDSDSIIALDDTGTLRIGDSTSPEPVLTRDEESNMTDGQALFWDATNHRAVTGAIDVKANNMIEGWSDYTDRIDSTAPSSVADVLTALRTYMTTENVDELTFTAYTNGAQASTFIGLTTTYNGILEIQINASYELVYFHASQGKLINEYNWDSINGWVNSSAIKGLHVSPDTAPGAANMGSATSDSNVLRVGALNAQHLEIGIHSGTTDSMRIVAKNNTDDGGAIMELLGSVVKVPNSTALQIPTAAPANPQPGMIWIV